MNPMGKAFLCSISASASQSGNNDPSRKLKMIMKNLPYVITVAGALLAPAFVTSGHAVERPNIVFILADDLGWADLGCYGADLHETPNLDKFASQGVRFTQAYAMSVCSPTRAAIQTGKHAARLHITIWREGTLTPPPMRKVIPPQAVSNLPLEETTIADALKTAGYMTFHVGKWHLGDASYYPETQGFDVNIGGTQWGAPNTYFYPFSGTNTFGDFRYVPGLGPGKSGDYLTDRLTDEAIKLIDAAGKRPFYLNLCFHNPHTPIEAKTNRVEYFSKKLKPGMHHQNPTYAAMINILDENIGRLLAHLEKRGLTKKTVVVFNSDNGGFLGNRKGRVTDNYPLRSGKGSLYEGGVRVPLMVRWPGVTPRGAVCDEPVICMDYIRTIAEIVGLPESALGGSGIDGVSLVPLLKDPKARLAREALYFHYPHYYETTSPVSAMRQRGWKFLEYYENGKTELYNLAEDPSEQHDLAAQMPDRAADLKQKLHAWLSEVNAQLPTPNPTWKGKGK